MVAGCGRQKGKIIFIGNGASASISSHMAVDFWKNARIKAMAFNDAVLLTCISNDFGYDQVFARPIDVFAHPGDILFAISSSGSSRNIIEAVRAARRRKVKIITFSGFLQNNPLSKLGDLNFYVPASRYGLVEVIHHSLCHYILNLLSDSKNRKKR